MLLCIYLVTYVIKKTASDWKLAEVEDCFCEFYASFEK